MVHVLLAAGASIQIKGDNNGQTPLHAAAQGDPVFVHSLFKAGAKENLADSLGQTLLYFAAWNGHHHLVRLLVVAGNQDQAESHGQSPLHSAAWGGHLHVVRFLLEANASPHRTENRGCTFALCSRTRPYRCRSLACGCGC